MHMQGAHQCSNDNVPSGRSRPRYCTDDSVGVGGFWASIEQEWLKDLFCDFSSAAGLQLLVLIWATLAPPLMVNGRIVCSNVWESTNGRNKDDLKIRTIDACCTHCIRGAPKPSGVAKYKNKGVLRISLKTVSTRRTANSRLPLPLETLEKYAAKGTFETE